MPAILGKATNKPNKSLSSRSAPIRTFFKVLNTDKLPDPKCNVNIVGKDYKGKLRVALDPCIDRLIYNALKDLNDCQKNKKVETRKEACFTKLKSLFSTSKEVDKSCRTVFQQHKSWSVIVATSKRGRKSSKKKENSIDERIKLLGKKKSIECACEEVAFPRYARSAPSKRRLSRLFGKSSLSRSSSQNKCSDISVIKNQCLSDPTVVIYEDLEKIDSLCKSRSKIDFTENQLSKISLKCVKTNASIKRSPIVSGRLSWHDMAAEEVPADKPSQATSSLFDEPGVSVDTHKRDLDYIVQKKIKKIEQESESEKEEYSSLKRRQKEKLLGPTTIQPILCINGKRIYFSTNSFAPKKNTNATLLLKSADEFLQQITDTGIIDRPENVRIITPYKISSIEKKTTPDGSKKIEVFFAGGQTMTILTKYNREQNHSESHSSEDTSSQDKFSSEIKEPFQNAISLCSCHQTAEVYTVNNENVTNQKALSCTVSSCNSKFKAVDGFKSSSKLIEVSNFKPSKKNVSKGSLILPKKSYNGVEKHSKKDISVFTSVKSRPMLSNSKFKALLPHFNKSESFHDKVGKSLNSAVWGINNNINSHNAHRLNREFSVTVYQANRDLKRVKKKTLSKWASPLLPPSSMSRGVGLDSPTPES